MAHSTAALTTAETTGFNADKPLFVVQQATSPNDAHWTTTGKNTGTDVTLSSEPATRAYDELGSLVTSSTGVASTSPKYFNFYFATAITIDTLVILGHNFNSIGITSVALEIADNEDFDEDVREIAKYTISGTDDNRILVTNLNGTATTTVKSCNTNSNTSLTVPSLTSLRIGDLITGAGIPAETYIEAMPGSTEVTMTNAASSSLTGIAVTFTQRNYSASGTPERFSGVQYARLNIVHSGSKDPEFAEVILGRRYQLQRNPDLPYDNKKEYSEVTESRALSGLVRRYVQYRGQARRSFKASMGSSDEITVIEDWWDAIDEGTRPFVYIETPNTAAKAYLMIMESTQLDFPFVGPIERVLSFSMAEQPRYRARE